MKNSDLCKLFYNDNKTVIKNILSPLTDYKSATSAYMNLYVRIRLVNVIDLIIEIMFPGNPA